MNGFEHATPGILVLVVFAGLLLFVSYAGFVAVFTM